MTTLRDDLDKLYHECGYGDIEQRVSMKEVFTRMSRLFDDHGIGKPALRVVVDEVLCRHDVIIKRWIEGGYFEERFIQDAYGPGPKGVPIVIFGSSQTGGDGDSAYESWDCGKCGPIPMPTEWDVDYQ